MTAEQSAKPMSIPNIADLTPEQRRVMCAEELGWLSIRRFLNNLLVAGYVGFAPDDPFPHTAERDVPDPDKEPRDALALCDHLAKDEWLPEIYMSVSREWIATFTKLAIEEVIQGPPQATFCLAATSAFLIATGRAK